MKYFRSCSSLLLLLLSMATIASAQQIDLSKFADMKARSIGPGGMSGRVTSIDVVRDKPDVIYAGTASGGLWRSTSGGIAWEPLTDSIAVASVGAVAIFQKNPSIIWFGSGEGNPRNSQSSGNGIYRSIDGGRTWERKGLEKTRNIHRVIIHPDNPNVVYAAVQGSAWGPHPERGIFKTTDGGESWQHVLKINESTGAADMLMDPENPDKLIAAMWQFRRWPWFFKSGGEGSGLYVTHDGGNTWVERTDKDGLPKGELGRIGLAQSVSSPEVIYALVESKKNALYKSTDGGFKWKMINNGNDIGDRPFYYADIFVDPQNENRVYTLYSRVAMSEDGGRSFEVILPYSGVHPDHHAWYIHPDDPSYIIDGNDGGLNISRDRGRNWRFVENLPLAQFYHINYDTLTPYNVYGGMQDNGSWRGPAYVWKYQGIRNSEWQEVLFGDGFDVVPDALEPERYGYAMSQGGNVARYDLLTGNSQLVKPNHPEGLELRYNWNAAIAQDPHNPMGIYYGSQFVHYSDDKGQSWQVLSPDLTTNNPERQKQLESGGLTYDVTQAENYTTITAIAPSKLEKGVVWVGTDDGNVQLTRNGGDSWENFAAKLPGAAENSWITQIRPSEHRAGEAYVAANNYRQNDWTPYLYRTRDYGRTWERLLQNTNMPGYVHSIVQDPIEPNLLFLGTELGLYVSFDEGRNFQLWKHGVPQVSVIDLQIQPKEHDLVIGTFGRAAFILDDIRPLRAVAQQGAQQLSNSLQIFDAPVAYIAQMQQPAGMRFGADATFAGENRLWGAQISYYLPLTKKEQEAADKKAKEEAEKAIANAKKKRRKKGKVAEALIEAGDEKDEEDEEAAEDKVMLYVLNMQGDTLRTMKFDPESGLNRVRWGLDRKGVRMPTQAKPKKETDERGGFSVVPGSYKIVVSYNGMSDATTIEVKADPRLNMPQQVMATYDRFFTEMGEKVALATEAADRLREAKESIEMVNKLLPEKAEATEEQEELRKAGKEVNKSIMALMEQMVPKEDVQGIFRNPNILSAKLGQMMWSIDYAPHEITPNQQLIVREATSELERVIGQVNRFFSTDWAEYHQQVKAANLLPTANYDMLELR